MTPREELIDAGAEAGWQDEAMRATRRPRFEAWREQSDATRSKWRGTAEVILLCFEAHAGGCVVVPNYAAEGMQDAFMNEIHIGGDGSSIEFFEEGLAAAFAASPYAPETKP